MLGWPALPVAPAKVPKLGLGWNGSNPGWNGSMPERLPLRERVLGSDIGGWFWPKPGFPESSAGTGAERAAKGLAVRAAGEGAAGRVADAAWSTAGVGAELWPRRCEANPAHTIAVNIFPIEGGANARLNPAQVNHPLNWSEHRIGNST